MPRNPPAVNGQAVPKRPRGRPRKTPPPPPPNGQSAPATVPAEAPAALDYYRGSDMPSADLSFLWHPYIPRSACTVLYGPLKRGKSTVARSLVAAVTRGHPLPGAQHTIPRDCIWFASEEHLRSVVRPRLAHLGANLDRVHFPQDRRDGTRGRLLIPDHARQLQQLVERTRAALIVLDPAKSFVGGEYAPDSGTAARMMVDCLTEIAGWTDSAFLLLMHPRKGGRGNADDQISGSLEWLNCPRSALKVADAPDKPGERVLIHHKGSLDEEGPTLRYRIHRENDLPSLSWLGQSGCTAEDTMAAELDAADRNALADARLFLREYLTAEAKPVKEVEVKADQAGIRPATLRRAKVAEGVDVRFVRTAGEIHWEWYYPAKGAAP